MKAHNSQTTMKIVLLKLAALALLSGNHANAADNLRGGVIRAAGIAVADEYNPNKKSAAQKLIPIVCSLISHRR
jgi:hypothetical protein